MRDALETVNIDFGAVIVLGHAKDMKIKRRRDILIQTRYHVIDVIFNINQRSITKSRKSQHAFPVKSSRISTQ